jgi:hypothetical protein
MVAAVGTPSYVRVVNPEWQARDDEFDRMRVATIDLKYLIGKPDEDIWPPFLSDPNLYTLGQLCAMANVLEFVVEAMKGQQAQPETPAGSDT